MPSITATDIGAAPNKGRPTKVQAEERNRKLLEISLEMFLQNGFEATRLSEIIQPLGITKRTFFSNYGNKITLFKAAIKHAIDNWIVPTSRLHEAEGDDLEETLLRIAGILSDNILSPMGVRLVRITTAASYQLPEISAYAYEQCTQPIIAYLADLFRRRLPSGDGFHDAEHYALAFMSLVTAPVRIVGWGVHLRKEEIDMHVGYAVRIFLNGLMQREGVRP